MRKIGILINSLEGGGAQTQAIYLMKELAKAGIDVYLFLLEQNQDIYLWDDKTHIKFNKKIIILSRGDSRANTLKKIALFPRQWINLRKAIKDLNIDVLISFMERANITNLITSDVKKRIIRSSTNIASALYFKPPLKRYLIKFFYPLLLNRAKTIVFNSKGVALNFFEVFSVDKQRVKVIYNLCDIERIKILAKEPIPDEINHFSKKQTVITIGRLIRAKGHWHLLRIFQRLCNTNTNLYLIILGDGPLKKELYNLSKELNIQDRVFFAGFQKNPMSWLAKADLFVLTSLWEGFPNVLLEAMALGIPVVSTDCSSGPREILAPNSNISKKTERLEFAPFGLLTPPLDGKWYSPHEPLTSGEKILVEAIQKMLKDPGLRLQYGKKALERAEDFSFQRIIPKWIEIIKG